MDASLAVAQTQLPQFSQPSHTCEMPRFQPDAVPLMVNTRVDEFQFMQLDDVTGQVMDVAGSMRMVLQLAPSPQQPVPDRQSSHAHPPPGPPMRAPRKRGVMPAGKVAVNERSMLAHCIATLFSVNVPEAMVPDVGVQLDDQAVHPVNADVMAALIPPKEHPAAVSLGVAENAVHE
jgi:hypothetical protein